MEFEWDEGNLSKLEKVRTSGRNLTVDEIESVFEDPTDYFVLRILTQKLESHAIESLD